MSRASPSPEPNGTGPRPHLGRAEDGVRRHEDRDRQRGLEQQLLVEERLPSHQQPEDDAVARAAQRDGPPDDERDQELADQIRLAVGVADQAGGEAGEQAADEGGRPAARTM